MATKTYLINAVRYGHDVVLEPAMELEIPPSFPNIECLDVELNIHLLFALLFCEGVRTRPIINFVGDNIFNILLSS